MANGGYKGDPQNFDRLRNGAVFYFLSQTFNIGKHIFTDASVSLNTVSYNWERSFPLSDAGHANYRNVWLPNWGITYVVTDGFSIRGKLGKGSSAPTSEEIRSSVQSFRQDLGPEAGWNKEVGVRKQFGNTLFLEASYFDFRLKNAIVRSLNDAGQEFFSNAGATVQKGLEVLMESKKFVVQNDVLQYFRLRMSGSFYRFRFADYRQDGQDFSGNAITGVPARSISALLQLGFKKGLAVDFSHYYTSGFPLNDAGSTWSQESLVANLQLKFPVVFKRFSLQAYLQVQNLYNSEYVLGFDTNALGGRYYNPAANRQVMVGISTIL